MQSRINTEHSTANEFYIKKNVSMNEIMNLVLVGRNKNSEIILIHKMT